MIGGSARRAGRAIRLLLLLSLPLLPWGCSGTGETAVAGIASWRRMGIEGVALRAVPSAAAAAPGAAPPAVEGRTTYHGAFALSLPPGRWRIEAAGEVPFGRGTARLRGAVEVDVPAGAPRVDRVALLLEEADGEGKR